MANPPPDHYFSTQLVGDCRTNLERHQTGIDDSSPTDEGTSTFPFSGESLVVLIAIILGIWFRVGDLARKSLWYDETMTLQRIAPATFSEVITDLAGSPFPPLHYLILKFWTNQWGTSAGSIRSLSTCVAITTFLAFYLSWKSLIGRRFTAIGLCLLACNAFHIWYSQDGKMYASVWLFATLSCGSFLNYLSSGKKIWLVMFGLSNACLTLTSYIGISVTFVQLLFLAALYMIGKDRKRRVVALFITTGISLNPLVVWITQVHNQTIESQIQWIPKAEWQSLGSSLGNLIASFSTGFPLDLTRSIGLWGVTLELCGLICTTLVLGTIATACTKFIRFGRHASPGIAPHPRSEMVSSEVLGFLVLWFALPIIGNFLYSICFKSLWGVPRYLIGSAPALLILLAIGLGSIRSRLFSTTIFTIIVFSNFSIIAFDKTHETRLPWSSVAHELKSLSQDLALHRSAREGTPSESPVQDQRLVVTKIGWLVDFLSLEHAAKSAGFRTKLKFQNQELQKSFLEPKPFVIICWREAGNGLDPLPAEVHAYDSSWRFVLKKSVLVYQDYLAATPSPFQPSQIDIIACYPLAPDGPEAHRYDSLSAGNRFVLAARAFLEAFRDRASRLRRRVLSGSRRCAAGYAALPPADAGVGDGRSARRHPCRHADRRSVAWWMSLRSARDVPAPPAPMSHGGAGGPAAREADAAPPRLY